jgi:putative zinc finger protein
MCEHSGKLVAWMDGEISAAEASEIARHVAECAECRSCVAELRNVSGKFEEYCNAVLQACAPREASWRTPGILAAAAAIILALVVTHGRRPVAQPVLAPSETASVVSNAQPDRSAVESMSGGEKRDVQSRRKRRARAAAPLQARTPSQSERSAADEPALRIAIPADAIFAPGALPDGMIFVADLSIGADGRVEQLRLVPQPVPFERRLEQ